MHRRKETSSSVWTSRTFTDAMHPWRTTRWMPMRRSPETRWRPRRSAEQERQGELLGTLHGGRRAVRQDAAQDVFRAQAVASRPARHGVCQAHLDRWLGSRAERWSRRTRLCRVAGSIESSRRYTVFVRSIYLAFSPSSTDEQGRLAMRTEAEEGARCGGVRAQTARGWRGGGEGFAGRKLNSDASPRRPYFGDETPMHKTTT